MGLFDIFKKKNIIEPKKIIKCKNNKDLNENIPYYLSDTEKFDMDKILDELKQFSKTGSLNKDEIYDSMINKLNIIKNNITWDKELPNNNIELCSEGLKLSIELCNYCIKKEYAENLFVKSQTKDYFNYFTEQLEHWKIYNEYRETQYLEMNGLFEEALERYLALLENHIPLSSVYYESPFYLSIKILNYESAFNVYSCLKDNFNETCDRTLEITLNNLTEIINSLETRENMYPKIRTKIISIIKDTPGIIQADLYKNFDDSYKETLKFIIYYLEKSNTVKREKSGRSYKLSIMQ